MKAKNIASLLAAGALFGMTNQIRAADFDVQNEAEFRKIIPAGAEVKKVAGDMGFLEGPVWISRDGGFLVFSDIPNNELKKWTAAGGVTTFRKPSQNANGNTLDREGRLLTAEHSGRRISLTEADGTVRTLVDQFEGRKLNSPNDVVVKSDGTIWFTDPDYGLRDKPDRSGKEDKQQPGNFVFRFDPGTKEITAVIRDFDKPNGLCFSPDERKLYVADSGQPRHIRVFDVDSKGAVTNGRIFCKIDKGGPDGIRCDAGGRIWSSSGDGAQVFSVTGERIARIPAPEGGANLCFGGPDGKTLFLTARKSLYSISTLVTSAARPGAR